MKIKMIIASGDREYVEHLSGVLADRYADMFEVNVCSSVEHLQALLAAGRFNVALLEPEIASASSLSSIHLPLVLWSESYTADKWQDNLARINKYRRISSIAGNIMEMYAEADPDAKEFGGERAHITAVWSPHGGVGKTSVSLAYAARQVSNGKQATYLSLENFSSTSAYFPETGKSISTVFERLEANVHMLLMGIRQQDSGSGIAYFCGPDNYDDINILTAEDIEVLLHSCAMGTDEVVVDLSSQCDERVQQVFVMADTVLLVCDLSSISQVKLRQFMGQHNIAQRIQGKCVLVYNKGANASEEKFPKVVRLPLVQSADPISVYKTLSGSNFEG